MRQVSVPLQRFAGALQHVVARESAQNLVVAAQNADAVSAARGVSVVVLAKAGV